MGNQQKRLNVERGSELEETRAKANRRKPEEEKLKAQGVESMASPTVSSLKGQASLLGDKRFSDLANRAQLANTMVSLQKQQGNAYVQKVVGWLQASSKGEGGGGPLEKTAENFQLRKSASYLIDGELRKEPEVESDERFKKMRFHSEGVTHKATGALWAKSFTTGPDIFFKRGAHYFASTGSLSRGGGDRAAAQGEPRPVAVSKLQSPITAPLTVQRDWTAGELVKALEWIDVESFGVRPQSYKLYKVDTLPWNEERYQSKADWASGSKPIEVVSHKAKGYHSRKNMEIGVSRDFDAKEAAATIVHEATHAGQYEEAEEKKEAMADLVEREVEAHMKEERFRIQKGIPPKVLGIKRMMVEGREEVDEKSVRQFVEEKYGPKAYYIRRVPKPIGKNFENKVRQKFSA